MEIWLEKKDCTGCSACANVCPKNAIKMVEDECGFIYPEIDHELCINCGLCKKTCPIVNITEKKTSEQEVYACWSNDEENRYISTSGGLFTEFAKSVINKGGYVVGAAYNKDNMVEHKIVNSIDALKELRQSKYLQSNILNSYKDTKKLLDENNIVAFCGSPCQIAGLNSYLKKEYKNLLTLEFICRGMNSPKAYKCWLSEIENKEQKKVSRVWFKYKINGWNSSPRCTRVDFADGTNIVYDGDDNKFMSGYLGPNLYIRPSCGDCKFNGIQRQADITLADFWGIEKKLDNDKGTSMVLINSEKGKEYFDSIKDRIYYEKKQLEDILKGNECFINSVDINKNSEKFLKELNENNFTEKVIEYSKVSIAEKLIKKIKRVIKRILNLIEEHKQ